MIDRILNDYYTKKLLEEIKYSFIVRNLDYRYKFDKYEVWIDVKPYKYSNDFYSTIIHLRKEDALKYLCDLSRFQKEVDKIVIEYQERKE